MKSDCSRAREAMLTAAPDPLRGIGAGALPAHIRSCAACRRSARRALAAAETLGAALGEIRPTRTADAIADLALSRSGMDRRSWRAAHPLRRAWPVIPLAAAAAAAAILLSGEPALEPAPLAPLDHRPEPARTVELRSSGDAAVFRAPESEITVVWLY